MGRASSSALRMLLVMTVVLGGLYPLAVLGIGRVAFSARADGSLVERGGRVVGSSLIGQSFEGSGWFIGRPDRFDPTASGPSNLGPTNQELGAAVQERLASLDIDPDVPVPIDAVTSSASGLDPHITPAFARSQAARVAEARNLELNEVIALIEEHTDGRTLGFMGEPRVLVLELNLALDELAPMS